MQQSDSKPIELICKLVEDALGPGLLEISASGQAAIFNALAGALPPSCTFAMAGSGLSGTAVEENSGLDIFVIDDAFQRSVPSRIVHQWSQLLGAPTSPAGTYCGWYGKIEELQCCLVPACRDLLSHDLLVPTPDLASWKVADPLSHLNVVQSLSPTERTVIRFLKHWNYAKRAKLRTYFIERASMEAMSKTWVPDQFHWKLKESLDFIFAGVESGSTGIDAFSISDEHHLLPKIEHVLDLSRNAWFLLELDAATYARDACGLYVEMLSIDA